MVEQVDDPLWISIMPIIKFTLLILVLFFVFVCLRWVEQDAIEILQSVYECMEKTCGKLNQLNININNIKGITLMNKKAQILEVKRGQFRA